MYLLYAVTTCTFTIHLYTVVQGVLQVYNNVLGGTNTPGWMDLQQVAIIILFIAIVYAYIYTICLDNELLMPMQINRTQSQLLLLNAEQFSFQWASTLNVSENRTIISDNIGNYTTMYV